MAVIVIAQVPGMTFEGYNGMIAMLGDRLRSTKGLIAHTAGPTDDGWRVVEIWESGEAANQFFAREVHPNLPPGIKPRRSVQPLHNVIAP